MVQAVKRFRKREAIFGIPKIASFCINDCFCVSPILITHRRTFGSMVNRFLLISSLSVLAVFAVGCGDGVKVPKTVPVTGTVTLDGKPVDGASVNLISEEGNITSSGQSDASGKFTLTTIIGSKSVPGAVPGKHKVCVVKTSSSGGAAPTSSDPKELMAKMLTNPSATNEVKQTFLVPQKYSSPSSTPISAEVTEAGPNDLKVDLSSK